MKSIVFLVLVLFMAGCSSTTSQRESGEKRFHGYGYKIVTDQTTGCKYVFGNLSSSPLYGSDGEVEGCGDMVKD